MDACYEERSGEAELGDARDDQRLSLGIATVDQDMAFGSGEQERRDAGSADVIRDCRRSGTARQAPSGFS
jgi:hypothetical protein